MKDESRRALSFYFNDGTLCMSLPQPIAPTGFDTADNRWPREQIEDGFRRSATHNVHMSHMTPR